MPNTELAFNNLLNEWLSESWETFQDQEEESMKFPKKEKNKSWGKPKNQERVVPKKARRAKLKEWE